METTTISEKQTQKIAQNFAKNLKGGDTVALYGDLGSGKTVFVKGLAKGLGIKRRITSPTFVFVKSYKISKGFFHHVDLYRGEQQED
ncbi:tRNA (adenosine(37)-N6)-threonylcarbamoyltransferase complex ATPase subunit type 1 TsaE, partial [Candidatus Curtissbacteria bacterium RIFOXYB2_FULL_41_10]